MGFSKVNPALRKKIKGLSASFTDRPQPELLIPLPNPCPDIHYKITVTTPEFTSLCPITPAQPDYATITIEYYPKDMIIELKSLKFYLASYRMVEIFYEEATNRILEDLVDVVKPKRMEVVADWNIRGGVGTRVKASYNRD